jgi:hypothetical protein
MLKSLFAKADLAHELIIVRSAQNQELTARADFDNL